MRRLVAVLVVLGLAGTALADPEPVRVRRESRVATAVFLVGVGGISLTAGIGLGIYAHAKYRDAFDSGNCMATPSVPSLCNAQGVDQTHRAITYGDAGTLLGLGGALFIAAGAIVYLTAPKDSFVVAPVADAHSAGVAVAARF